MIVYSIYYWVRHRLIVQDCLVLYPPLIYLTYHYCLPNETNLFIFPYCKSLSRHYFIASLAASRGTFMFTIPINPVCLRMQSRHSHDILLIILKPFGAIEVKRIAGGELYLLKKYFILFWLLKIAFFCMHSWHHVYIQLSVLMMQVKWVMGRP